MYTILIRPILNGNDCTGYDFFTDDFATYADCNNYLKSEEFLDKVNEIHKELGDDAYSIATICSKTDDTGHVEPLNDIRIDQTVKYVYWIEQSPISCCNAFMPWVKAKNDFSMTDYCHVWKDSIRVDRGKTLEDVCETLFTNYNLTRPEHYAGRSMSTGDLIIFRLQDRNCKVYYCDSFGFKDITEIALMNN